MFVREKTINGYTYLYLVESVREGRRTRQRIIKKLGRKEAVLAAGGLERLAASMSRFVASVEVRARLDAGKHAEDRLRALAARRIGAPLLFGRLWAVRPAVGGDRLSGGARGAFGAAQVRVFGRACRLHRRPPPHPAPVS